MRVVLGHDSVVLDAALLFVMDIEQNASEATHSTDLGVENLGADAAPAERRDSVPAIDHLYESLHAIESIAVRSRARDDLWIALWETVTTRSEAWITPIGSSARVRVTKDDADAELIAAWELSLLSQ